MNQFSLKHNQYAPFWAAAMLLFLISGLSGLWIRQWSFWNSYILDMCGPAWTYILFRGLFTTQVKNRWTRFFNPVRTFFILLATSFSIELLQFLKIYEATYDPMDFVAYITILTPVFLIDFIILRKTQEKFPSV